MMDDSMTRRLEDATASERRSRTGYIKRSEMCSDRPQSPCLSSGRRYLGRMPGSDFQSLCRGRASLSEGATTFGTPGYRDGDFQSLSSPHRFIPYDLIGTSSYDTVNWKMVVVPSWMVMVVFTAFAVEIGNPLTFGVSVNLSHFTFAFFVRQFFVC